MASTAPGLRFEPLRQILLERAGFDPTVEHPRHAPIKKAMAEMCDVNVNTVNRWCKTDRIPLYSADRVVTERLGQHPIAIWGWADYSEGVRP